MKKSLFFLVFFSCILLRSSFGSIMVDSNFLSNYYSKGGSVLFDKKGNIVYLWIHTNRENLNLNNLEDWQRLSYAFKFKMTKKDGKIVAADRSLIELGPHSLYLYTSGIFDSNGNLFAMWDLCVRSDVVSRQIDEISPFYAILVKMDSLGKDAKPCTVLPFHANEFFMTIDNNDTIWAVGRTPGANMWGLCTARLFPNPQQEYELIYGGRAKGQEYNPYNTSTGNGLYSPGLIRHIIGFSINQSGQFILCDRMSRIGKENFNNILVSNIINKKGKLLRDPYEIPIEEAASKIIRHANLSNTEGIQLSEIFTEGTRIVNYGKDRIFSIVAYKDNIYIIPLSDNGIPINEGNQENAKPQKLPEKWKPSLRLWTYLTKDNTLFYIFGIDEEANFYWETVTVE